MPGPPPDIAALTDREKRTLRLLLEGHDAKSAARQLGLSVHTINERLRDARRKLAVSSSKEAARLLRQAEAAAPQPLGDKPFGDAVPTATGQVDGQPGATPWSRRPAARAIGGFAMITIVAALLALAAPEAPPPAAPAAPAAPASDASSPEAEAVAAAARAWLELGDAARWDDAFAATGASFRAANTPQVWRRVSEKVRAPLGRVLSRTLVTRQEAPTPPRGGWTVRFRTDFAEKKGAVETLSLAREDGAWKVVGIYLE